MAIKDTEEKEPGYLTIKETAERFSIPRRQVKLALENRELRASKVGRCWVITKEAVVAWLKTKETA